MMRAITFLLLLALAGCSSSPSSANLSPEMIEKQKQADKESSDGERAMQDAEKKKK